MEHPARRAPAVLSEVVDLVGRALDRPCTGEDDFFEIGGSSLTAMRVVALIEDRLGVSVSLEEFFDAPDLRAFAEAVAARSPDAHGAGEVPTG